MKQKMFADSLASAWHYIRKS